MNDSMPYPAGGAGFQAHSETSRAAAHGRKRSGAQRESVFDFIAGQGNEGATTDEVKAALLERGMIGPNSIMSARVRELEMAGRVVKTTITRDTSAGFAANVYVTAEVFQRGGFERDFQKEKPAAAKAPAAEVVAREILAARMVKALSGYTLHGGQFGDTAAQIIINQVLATYANGVKVV